MSVYSLYSGVRSLLLEWSKAVERVEEGRLQGATSHLGTLSEVTDNTTKVSAAQWGQAQNVQNILCREVDYRVSRDAALYDCRYNIRAP